MSSDQSPFLHIDSSDLSTNLSPSIFPSASPSSPRHRQAYQRLPSSGAVPQAHEHDGEEGDIADTFDAQSAGSGLGIATQAKKVKTPKRVSVQSIPRKSVGGGIRSPPSHDDSAPGSANLMQSPEIMFHPSPPQDTSYGGGGGGGMGGFGSPPEGQAHKAKSASVSSLHSSYQQPYQQPSYHADNVPLKHATPSMRSVQSAFEREFHPPHACPPSRPFHRHGCSWLGFSLLLISLFSTAFSLIFLIIALLGVRWEKIKTGSGFKPNDAIILTTVFAKAIEMSFVAVFVTFLGQALSRRAFNKSQGRGITLAELSMRNWVLQPGTMFTHPESIRYGLLSVLGILSLVATIVATLYTTAAQALVQPQLRFSNWEPRVMSGLVKSSFSNVKYVMDNCQTPILPAQDAEAYGQTCFQIENSAQAFINYQRYLSDWTSVAEAGNGTDDLRTRPQGFGLFHENTTMQAPWIEVVPVSKDADGRIINNVSLAFPHIGVFQAARDPVNKILQPEDLDGLGVYHVKASVASPVINTLCVQTIPGDLDPLVYTAWNNKSAAKNFNASAWPAQVSGINMTNFKNTTKLDDIFHWGTKYGMNSPDGPNMRAAYPIFSKYPLPYNTVLNTTQSGFWGRDAIYLLGTGGGTTPESASIDGKNVICKISAYLSPNCSTSYNVTSSGGSMAAECENPNDDLRYIVSNWNATHGAATTAQNWFDIGSEWGNSLSLNAGINDGKASNARLLMQFLLGSGKLSKALPSTAEALAVMAGSTLVFGTQDAPFNTEEWNYTAQILATGQYQYFNASIQAQSYASGGAYESQKGFMLILFIVFIANVLILIYFLWYQGLVTDYSEPPNLFSLAINSPPSHLLAGSCGAGPSGDQYKVNWFLSQEGEHLFVESGAEPPGYTMGGARESPGMGYEMNAQSPMQNTYARLSKRRSFL